MRSFLSVLLLSSAALAQAPARTPVLVELFTSEGCSSCPPVDKALAQLEEQQPLPATQIILLGFHVDYWNHDGWTDRFSSPQFTHRQEEYAPRSPEGVPYTPQIIVDGVVRPYDPTAIKSDIKSSASNAKPVALTLTPAGENALTISSAGGAKDAELFFAVTEDDLRTEVKGGENGGRVLTHPAVVRLFLPLGRFKDNASRTVPLRLAKDWRRDHLHAVCFVQEKKSGKVLGVASLAISTR